jgi:hypothetical protein
MPEIEAPLPASPNFEKLKAKLRELFELDKADLDFGIYRTTMHSWQIETLRKAIDLNLHIVEVPITYRAGRSSFNRRIAKDALKVWATI